MSVTVTLTGARRFRPLKQWFKATVLILQLEERVDCGPGPMPPGRPKKWTQWRDARVEDLTKLQGAFVVSESEADVICRLLKDAGEKPGAPLEPGCADRSPPYDWSLPSHFVPAPPPPDWDCWRGDPTTPPPAPPKK